MHRAITAHAIGDDHNVANVRSPVTANVAARTVYAAAIRPPGMTRGTSSDACIGTLRAASDPTACASAHCLIRMTGR